MKRLSYSEKEAAFKEIDAFKALLHSDWFAERAANSMISAFLADCLADRRRELDYELNTASEEYRAKRAAQLERQRLASRYAASFACDEAGHGARVQMIDGLPHCEKCGKPWTHIGEVTE